MTVKKNILFLSHTAQMSGAEMCLLELLKGLDRSKYSGLVIVPNDQPLKSKIEEIGWRTQVYHIPWWARLRYRNRWHLQDVLFGLPGRLRTLRKIVKEHNIDLIYTNTIVTLDGAIFAKLFGLPHIWHIHELPSIQRFLKFYLPTNLLPPIVHLLSTRIIVPSAVAKRHIQWRNGKRVHIVNNGVDIPHNRIDCSTRFKKSLGISPEKKIIAIAGSLNENKRLPDFIKAARLARQKIYNVAFLIVGSGNRRYTRFVKDMIALERMESEITMVGFRSDMDTVLNSIDVLVSASRSECFPLIILEAMAAGKPVIATMSGGAEEQVIHGKTGLLVPHSNPKLLGQSMVDLLSNDTLTKEMGRNAYERVRSNFLKTKYVDGVSKVIEACMSP